MHTGERYDGSTQDIDTVASQMPLLADQLELEAARGRNTHYTLAQFPHVYIKAAPVDTWQGAIDDDMASQYSAYGHLKDAGVEVIPFRFVRSEETVYTVGRKIVGQPLPALIGITPDVGRQYDANTAALIEHAGAHRGRDYLFPKEIFGPEQYLWGSPSDEADTEPAVWFIDVEPSGELGTILNFADMDSSSTSLLESAVLAVRRIRRDTGFEMASSISRIRRAVYALREAHPAESVLLELEAIEEMALGQL